MTDHPSGGSNDELREALTDAVAEAGGVEEGRSWRLCSGCGEPIDPSDPIVHRDPPANYRDDKRTLADVASGGYGEGMHHPGHNETCLFCKGGGKYEKALQEGFNSYFQQGPGPDTLRNRDWKALRGGKSAESPPERRKDPRGRPAIQAGGPESQETPQSQISPTRPQVQATENEVREHPAK